MHENFLVLVDKIEKCPKERRLFAVMTAVAISPGVSIYNIGEGTVYIGFEDAPPYHFLQHLFLNEFAFRVGYLGDVACTRYLEVDL